ncbi:hypothetical protein AB0H83_31310 [Dactylosporangium sp. NPDC050688]|uniref:hypothetical protein n=1 Tax=Dactylosporangium sp. NPDC050688 TaxID=3157217 RepID=UPI0033C47694
MTSAARAYELPDDSLTEVVAEARLGNVVYLVRDGERVAVVQGTEARIRELEDVALAADAQLRAEAESARKTLALVEQSFPEGSPVGQSVRALLDERVAAAEDIADLAAARAAMARIEAGEETVSFAQLVAELEEPGE